METGLVGLLRSSVERYPDKTAIEHDEIHVTYAELWDKVVDVACYLVHRGLEPEQKVALLIENSPCYVISYYAVLLAGGVVVGLNTAAKSRDMVNWIRHSEARYLIVDTRHPEAGEVLDRAGSLLEHAIYTGQGCDLDNATDWSAIPAVKTSPDLETGGKSARDIPAAIIYTSGTTGRPKGVVLSHANLYANICSIVDYLELTDNDSIVNLLPFFYTYGNTVLHSHLACGGTIILENSLLYPHRVMEKISERRVTGFSGVPSTFGLLLNRTDLADYDLTALRYITQAGGHMLPANIKRVRALIPTARFFVMYGQTEACSRLSYLPPKNLDDKLGSVGIAIPGVELEVRDETGNAVEDLVTGEIYARGENVMMGYWKDEAATKKVLVDGWLRTGDLAYRDRDGYFFIAGRSSEMIKSGAHRISPADVEEVVAEIDGIEDVAVVGIEDELLGQVVKAVVVRSPGCEIDKKEIMRHCKMNLAGYKMPRLVEFTDAIPRTTSGKIQRFKLIEKTE